MPSNGPPSSPPSSPPASRSSSPSPPPHASHRAAPNARPDSQPTATRRVLLSTLTVVAALATGYLVHRAGLDPTPDAQQLAAGTGERDGSGPAVSTASPQQTGRDLLAMRLADAAGNERSVAQTLPADGVRVVNFWASWCAPCVEEMPVLSQWSARQSGGHRVVGIAIDTAPNVERFLKRMPVEYPILVGTPAMTSQFARLGNPEGLLPFTIVLGPDGGVRETALGKVDANWLDRLVK